MRAFRATALLVAVGLLAACGRQPDTVAVAEGYTRIIDPFPAQVTRNAPLRRVERPTRPQPPLAALLDRPEVAEKPVQRRAERPRPQAKRPPKKDAAPKRTAVDRRLNDAKPRARPERRPERRAEPAPRALEVAARPTPKPITATPRPLARPVQQPAALAPVADRAPTVTARPAPLAPRPSIARLPSLGAPRLVADATPSALPDPSRAEAAIPIGRIPASLGAGNIQARESALPVADSLERSSAGESGGIGWDEAAALMRAGEVADAIDVGEYEVLMTLCSGRGVLTIQPEPDALAAVKMPEVICGKPSSLTSP